MSRRFETAVLFCDSNSMIGGLVSTTKSNVCELCSPNLSIAFMIQVCEPSFRVDTSIPESSI